MLILNFIRLYFRCLFTLLWLSLSLSLSQIILLDNSHLQELNDEVNTEKHLHLFRKNAEEFKLLKKLAQAHYCIGEHFLSKVREYIVKLIIPHKKIIGLYIQSI